MQKMPHFLTNYMFLKKIKFKGTDSLFRRATHRPYEMKIIALYDILGNAECQENFDLEIYCRMNSF